MDDTSTRDFAVQALTEIKAHIASCDRRYAEGNDRMEKIFAYIKDAHRATGDQIADATKEITDLQTALAEARGAGKMAKLIGGGISGAMGFIGGLGGHLALK